MNKYKQREVIEENMIDFEEGRMDRRTPNAGLNYYIKCFPADNWINTMIHRYNMVRNNVT